MRPLRGRVKRCDLRNPRAVARRLHLAREGQILRLVQFTEYLKNPKPNIEVLKSELKNSNIDDRFTFTPTHCQPVPLWRNIVLGKRWICPISRQSATWRFTLWSFSKRTTLPPVRKCGGRWRRTGTTLSCNTRRIKRMSSTKSTTL